MRVARFERQFLRRVEVGLQNQVLVAGVPATEVDAAVVVAFMLCQRNAETNLDEPLRCEQICRAHFVEIVSLQPFLRHGDLIAIVRRPDAVPKNHAEPARWNGCTSGDSTRRGSRQKRGNPIA